MALPGDMATASHWLRRVTYHSAYDPERAPAHRPHIVVREYSPKDDAHPSEAASTAAASGEKDRDTP